MLVATGWRSAIVQALLPLLPEGEKARRAEIYDEDLTADRYLFCAGVLRPKKIAEQSDAEMTETLLVNCFSVIEVCDSIIEANDTARICVIGSESGYSWSFDGAYAASKAALHRYVETKRLRTSEQQLVCVAPSIIGDAGMTVRREDKQQLHEREMTHPKGRFLQAAEVSRLIKFLLYDDAGYLTGTVIRMHGGEHR
jgi:NAD(P)-dependent dehydrogenase (short-subunit alcohol dehydrogenase family)